MTLWLHDYCVILAKQTVLIKNGLPKKYEKAEVNLADLTGNEIEHLLGQCNVIKDSLEGERDGRKNEVAG